MKIGRGGDVTMVLEKQDSDELTVDKMVCQEISGQKVDKIRWIHRLDMTTSPTSKGHSKLMEQKEVSMVAPKARRLQLKDTLPRRCKGNTPNCRRTVDNR